MNVKKLVKKMKSHSLNEKIEDDLQPQHQQQLQQLQPTPPAKEHQPYLRKSVRLQSAQKEKLATVAHDSGTESDDEELKRLEQEKICDESSKHYSDFLNSRSPPTVVPSPPSSAVLSEFDTESYDSTGAESGITVGFESNDCSRDSSDSATVLGLKKDISRRSAFRQTTIRSACEFPPMSMHNTGEKRRHSAAVKVDDQPIACRLRSNFDPNRPMVTAARRTPVRVLVNCAQATKPVAIASRKAEVETESLSPPAHSSAKRGRTNGYGRPTLDLDKMLEHRLERNDACEAWVTHHASVAAPVEVITLPPSPVDA